MKSSRYAYGTWLATLFVCCAVVATPQAFGQDKKIPNKNIDKLEKSWVEPDKTEPTGTKYKTFTSKTIKGEVQTETKVSGVCQESLFLCRLS